MQGNTDSILPLLLPFDHAMRGQTMETINAQHAQREYGRQIRAPLTSDVYNRSLPSVLNSRLDMAANQIG